jgi:hypothetical protein
MNRLDTAISELEDRRASLVKQMQALKVENEAISEALFKLYHDASPVEKVYLNKRLNLLKAKK